MENNNKIDNLENEIADPNLQEALFKSHVIPKAMDNKIAKPIANIL